MFCAISDVTSNNQILLLVGRVDKCRKTDIFFVGVRHFTRLCNGSIQDILTKNQPPRVNFTPGTFQNTVMAILMVF